MKIQTWEIAQNVKIQNPKSVAGVSTLETNRCRWYKVVAGEEQRVPVAIYLVVHNLFVVSRGQNYYPVYL